MRFEIIGINPQGNQFDVPMTLERLDNPYKAMSECQKLQDRFGPGYKFMLVPVG